MAKRKPSREERKRLKDKRADDDLLKRYAKHCYAMARAEKAIEEKLPISAIVPVDRQRHSDVERKTLVAIRHWFNKMGPGMQGRTRAKIISELESGGKKLYDKQSAPLQAAIDRSVDLAADKARTKIPEG